MKFRIVEVDPPAWLLRRRLVYIGLGIIAVQRGANVGHIHESWQVREVDRRTMRRLRGLRRYKASLAELREHAGLISPPR